MKILAEDLARLCYNAVQFSHKDSGLGGVVMFQPGFETLEVWASDDYVAMTDRAPLEDGSNELNFYLGLKEVKELERWLRDAAGTSTFELRVFDGDPKLHPGKNIILGVYWPDAKDHLLALDCASEPPDFSGVVEVIHEEGNPLAVDYGATAEPFAIRPERFTKFRLLRTPESPSCKDGYPVDFLWTGRLVKWKCGPFLRGVIGPLARHSFVDGNGVEVTGIRDLYREESDVLW